MMFSVKNAIITGHFLRKTRSGKSHDYRDAIVFEKLRFCDGLVCTVGLSVEIMLRFQIPPALCRRPGPRRKLPPIKALGGRPIGVDSIAQTTPTVGNPSVNIHLKSK